MSASACGRKWTLRCGNRCSAGRGFLCAASALSIPSVTKPGPSSGRNDLSPSLLACLHDFAHIPCRPNLENGAERQSRMLADELYSMIHVPRLKDENAAELFFGFGIGAVGRCHLAVLPRQGQCSLRPLKPFSTGPV